MKPIEKAIETISNTRNGKAASLRLLTGYYEIGHYYLTDDDRGIVFYVDNRFGRAAMTSAAEEFRVAIGATAFTIKGGAMPGQAFVVTFFASDNNATPDTRVYTDALTDALIRVETLEGAINRALAWLERGDMAKAGDELAPYMTEDMGETDDAN